LPVGRNVDGKRNAQKSNSLATGEHDRARNLTRDGAGQTEGGG
jgi:hypothetical protein